MSKTLSRSNQFAFVCPIFTVETKIAACLHLRDKVWRGEKVAVRQGCQAAMQCSKCPMVPMLQRMRLTGEDPYHSDTPVTGKLRSDLIDAIAPILISDKVVEKFAMSDRELELLRASSGLSVTQDGSKPARALTKRPKASKPPVVVSAAPDATVAAAVSGDMSAAINAGASS